jgi:choice-of-anchor A domain-containing protein
MKVTALGQLPTAAARCSRSLLVAALLLTGVFCPTSHAATLLGTAGDYNEFILGNSTRQFVDVHGKVAVGGNATFNGFAVATQMTNATTNLVVGGTLNANSASVVGSIVVGGDATYTQPTVGGNFASNGTLTLGNFGTVTGNLRYQTALVNPNTTVSGTSTGGVSTPLPVDFAAEAAYLNALSQAQVNPADPFGQVMFGTQLFFTGGAGANFFNVTGAVLANSTSGFHISAPAGSSVVINVSGTGFSIPNTGLTLTGGIGLPGVLWNFYEATSLNIVGSANGSFLAPMASITTASGAFNGNLIAGGISGSIEPHLVINGQPTPFDGTLRPVPEPASAALAAFGLAAAALRRRSRR